MAYGYATKKDTLYKRLQRVEGQVRGVSRMIEADTYCIDILTQISAAQAALDKVALELLHEHASHCMAEEMSEDARIEKADELVKAVARMH